MKRYVILLGCFFALPAQAECDMDLSGKWLLDNERFLQSAASVDPEVRQKLKASGGSESLIRLQFGTETGRGRWWGPLQKGWVTSAFDYQLAEDASGACVLSLSLDNFTEKLRYQSEMVTATDTGFCVLLTENGGGEHCYLRDNREFTPPEMPMEQLQQLQQQQGKW